MYVCVYVCIRGLDEAVQPRQQGLGAVVRVQDHRHTVPQQCTNKGRRRKGIVLKHRSSLQKEPMPCRHMPLLM